MAHDDLPGLLLAGAIFSGFAMVVTLIVPARHFLGLQDFVTPRHLDNMRKIMLVTGCMVGYAYGVEIFTAWYSGNPTSARLRQPRPRPLRLGILDHGDLQRDRATTLLVGARPALNSADVRHSIVINIGMWFERFVIIVSSLARDFLPSSWNDFHPTWVDMLTFAGTFGLFLTLFLLFLRFLPMMAMAETKAILPHAEGHEG